MILFQLKEPPYLRAFVQITRNAAVIMEISRINSGFDPGGEFISPFAGDEGHIKNVGRYGVSVWLNSGP